MPSLSGNSSENIYELRYDNLHLPCLVVRFMVFKTTFYNISVISWQSVLLVEETGENHRQTLSHNVVSSSPHHERDSNSQL